MNQVTFLTSFVEPFQEPWRSIILFLLALIVVIIFYLVIYTLRSIRFLVLDKHIGKKSKSFSILQENSTMSVLILGDSTAYGTGAKNVHWSVAGRLAKDHPHISIENHADNGAHTFDVAQKALRLLETSFDIVIIQVGGNDILTMTSPHHIHANLKLIVSRARKIAKKQVILVSPMNVSSSPLFWFPFNLLYGARSRMTRNIFHKVSKEPNVTLVDLYVPKYRDPFAQESKLYFAKDYVHPSDKGYGLIYHKLREIAEAYKILEKA